MTNRNCKFMLLAAAAFVLATVPLANAGQGPCVREAKRDAKDCGAECKETFQTAKDTCLNRDHACVEICRANRSQCRLDTGFDANIAICNDDLEAARAVCRANNPAGDARDLCIDLAQIDAFRCRDTERERAKPLLKECRRAFRDCAKACAVGNPLVEPRTCLRAAKDAAKTCTSDCREAFQVAKDDCRGRDHACVEDCRAARHTCRHDTVQPTLDSDLATCAANRQLGITDCNSQDPPLVGDALDDCIDGVQVAAFICRDAAHEAARPGFQQCRLDFRACVLNNCPVLP